MKNTLLSGDVALTRKKLLPLFLVYGTLIVLLVAAEILSPGFLAPQHWSWHPTQTWPRPESA